MIIWEGRGEDLEFFLVDYPLVFRKKNLGETQILPIIVHFFYTKNKAWKKAIYATI